MADTTCLITGATSGIGLETARALARRGLSLVLVGRSQERGDSAIALLKQETPGARAEFLRADLSSQAEIRRLAREFLARHQRLDILINNAGALFAIRQESVDGIEMTLALNHMAYFLLTDLLLDTIKASAPARIINVSSNAHRDVKAFDFDDPQAASTSRAPSSFSRRPYPRTPAASLRYALLIPWAHPGFIQYAHTKLANLLFTHELATRLEGTNVTVNALHPGFVATNFTAGNGAYGWLMRRWSTLFGITPEAGAQTIIHLATSAEVANTSGQYFIKEKPAPSSPAAHDRESARRLWMLSESLIHH